MELHVSGFNVRKSFSLNNTQTLVIHIYQAFVSSESLAFFTFFFFLVLLVFVGSRLAKSRAALQLKQQGFFFQTQEMVIHLYHGGGASYQVSARGYFAKTLILIPSAYTIQLQVLTTVIVICLLWTISESPYWGANISSCTSVAFPTCSALCL